MTASRLVILRRGYADTLNHVLELGGLVVDLAVFVVGDAEPEILSSGDNDVTVFVEGHADNASVVKVLAGDGFSFTVRTDLPNLHALVVGD